VVKFPQYPETNEFQPGRNTVKIMRMLLVLGGLTLLCLNLAVMAKTPEATAQLVDSKGKPVGQATFVQKTDGVHIDIQVQNLPPGKHGVHIHMVGKCDAPEFTTAGGHFNPTGKHHGALNPQGPHAGDIPNLTVGPNGKGRLQMVNANVTLDNGPNSLLDADGSALVVHAAADDEKTDPTGNSGARIACGVIHKKAGY
jgi:superoxide dismutase, Cu-Zn family